MYPPLKGSIERVGWDTSPRITAQGDFASFSGGAKSSREKGFGRLTLGDSPTHYLNSREVQKGWEVQGFFQLVPP